MSAASEGVESEGDKERMIKEVPHIQKHECSAEKKHDVPSVGSVGLDSTPEAIPTSVSDAILAELRALRMQVSHLNDRVKVAEAAQEKRGSSPTRVKNAERAESSNEQEDMTKPKMPSTTEDEGNKMGLKLEEHLHDDDPEDKKTKGEKEGEKTEVAADTESSQGKVTKFIGAAKYFFARGFRGFFKESTHVQDAKEEVDSTVVSADDTRKLDTEEVIEKVSRMQGSVKKGSNEWRYLEEVKKMGKFATYICQTEAMMMEFQTKKTPSVCDLKLEQSSCGKIVIPVPLIELERDDAHKVRQVAVRRKMSSNASSKRCKTILMVGATGAGKSTLLDGMMNYILGIEWDDNFILKVVNLTDEEKRRRGTGQAISQTAYVTVYVVPTNERCKVSYDFILIDTPGFGDTSGIKHDQAIISHIEYLFKNPLQYGVDSLDCICFVAKSPDARLTPTQRYISSRVLSVFGKDVAENIFIMATFADHKKPPIIDAMKKENIPFKTYFKFNNSVFGGNEESQYGQSNENEETNDQSDFDEQYWKIGVTSFKTFFSALGKVQPKSLTMTKEVLERRGRLKCDLAYIELINRHNTQKLATIERQQEVVKQNKDKIEANKNFEFEEEVTVTKAVPISDGRNVTNCSFCHETCHDDCYYAKHADKINCSAMSNGKCRICKNKCQWDTHYSDKFEYQERTVTETVTLETLKKQYFSALEGKISSAQLLNRLKKEYQQTLEELKERMKQARECILELQEKALKGGTLSEVEYIDLLIENEKDNAISGFKQRIIELKKLRKTAEIAERLALEVNNNRQADFN